MLWLRDGNGNDIICIAHYYYLYRLSAMLMFWKLGTDFEHHIAELLFIAELLNKAKTCLFLQHFT